MKTEKKMESKSLTIPKGKISGEVNGTDPPFLRHDRGGATKPWLQPQIDPRHIKGHNQRFQACAFKHRRPPIP
jgi:hypothetical protein